MAKKAAATATKPTSSHYSPSAIVRWLANVVVPSERPCLSDFLGEEPKVDQKWEALLIAYGMSLKDIAVAQERVRAHVPDEFKIELITLCDMQMDIEVAARDAGFALGVEVGLRLARLRGVAAEGAR